MTAIAETSDATQFTWRQVCADAMASLKTLDLPDDLQVPSLPTSLTEFMDASSKDDYDVKNLGRIVEHDPGMTVDLLKCVNVAAHGANQPVKTPTEALVRLGVPKARNYLLAAGLRGATLAHESRLMNHRNFWNESIRRNAAYSSCRESSWITSSALRSTTSLTRWRSSRCGLQNTK